MSLVIFCSVFENHDHQKWKGLVHNHTWLFPNIPIFHQLTLLLHSHLSSYHKTFFSDRLNSVSIYCLTCLSSCFPFCLISFLLSTDKESGKGFATIVLLVKNLQKLNYIFHFDIYDTFLSDDGFDMFLQAHVSPLHWKDLVSQYE